MQSNKAQAENKEASLLDNITEAENNNKIKLKELRDAHSEMYENKRSDQSQKMLTAAAAYQ